MKVYEVELTRELQDVSNTNPFTVELKQVLAEDFWDLAEKLGVYLEKHRKDQGVRVTRIDEEGEVDIQ